MSKKLNKSNANEDIIGYCYYCKDEIYEGEDYVIIGNKRYHLSCYKLIEDETSDE